MSNEAPVGWPTNERIEKLRGEWIAAPNAEARKEIAGETQTAAFEDRREGIVGCAEALNRSSRLGPTSHSAIASSEREQDTECPEDGRTGAKELGGRRIGEYTHLVGFLLGSRRAARR